MICAYSGSLVGSKHWQATQAESGMRLLKFLREKLGTEYSVRVLKQALENNACQINGRIEHFGSTLVGWGDNIKFSLNLLPSKKVKGAAKMAEISPSILFEDADFMIVDKPAGIRSEDIPDLKTFKTQGAPSPEKQLALAHRLDKETSGVLILTKSERAQKEIVQLFKNRQVTKNYLAIVEGIPNRSEGRIANFLGKISTYDGQNLWGPVDKEKGSQAITTWSLIKRGKGAALIACSPLTGRTHQIRIHLAGIGHAIIGDSLYNKSLRSAYWPKRCLLHASKITFIHPFTKSKVAIDALLPLDFVEALNNYEIQSVISG
jgi:RluA family pseudouridine synthase